MENNLFLASYTTSVEKKMWILRERNPRATRVRKFIFGFLALSVFAALAGGPILGVHLMNSCLLTEQDPNYPEWRHSDMNPWQAIPLGFVLLFGPPFLLAGIALAVASIYFRRNLESREIARSSDYGELRQLANSLT